MRPKLRLPKATKSICCRFVVVVTHEEHIVAAEVERALAADETLFQRGEKLVEIGQSIQQTRKSEKVLIPIVSQLLPPILRERIVKNAWLGKEHREGLARTHPPTWLRDVIFSRQYWPDIRHLEAVIDYPVLRPDGTIVDQLGYDEATGLFLSCSPELIPDIPDKPTKADAETAWNRLASLLVDFPFEAELYRAVWLAALLTPLARFALKGHAVPLFLSDANTPGTGKGKVLHIIPHILTGKDFGVTHYTDNTEELMKKITSLALGGYRLVFFDNVKGNLGNDVLDAALTTRDNWEDRKLGGNAWVRAPLCASWYATGNNVQLSGDTPRRVLHIRMHSTLEHPEDRKPEEFKIQPDLETYIAKHRRKLLGAALTILRAFCFAGRPSMSAAGSFEGWSDLVASSVVWLGLPDPNGSRLIMQKKSDTTSLAMKQLIAAWELMDPKQNGVTLSKLHKLLYEVYSTEPWATPLREAVETLTSCDKPTSTKLGYCFRSQKNRNFGNKCLTEIGHSDQGVRWTWSKMEELHKIQHGDDDDDDDPKPRPNFY
jgi:hypothetical protein